MPDPVTLKALKVNVHRARVSVVLPSGNVRTFGVNSKEGRMILLIADPYLRFNDTRYEVKDEDQHQ